MAGQSPLLATLLPLSVDGLLLVATIALGDGRRHRGSAWLAFFVGVAASLAANVLATPGGALARVVSAWPAVALLLTVEVLARSGKAAPVAAPVASAPAPVAVAEPVPVAATTGPAAEPPTVTGTAARVAALVADRPHLSAADVAASLGVSARTARRHLAATRTLLAAG
jgi:DNA-binding transcriptional ArsR family regulator